MSVEITKNGLALTLMKHNNCYVLTTNKFLEAKVEEMGTLEQPRQWLIITMFYGLALFFLANTSIIANNPYTTFSSQLLITYHNLNQSELITS